MRKIALEEHFMAPGFTAYEKNVKAIMDGDLFHGYSAKLTDFDGARLEAMNKAEIAISVLSQTSPGVQIETDAKIATERAKQANDFLKARIDEHPSRFAGFAHLAMQSPEAAAAELRRCVDHLGFCGALINGHTNGVYLDDPMYREFWQEVALIDRPIYLHPADAFVLPHAMQGRAQLAGPGWSWTVETASHALRLVASGLFDRLPTLKIILGHMGEALPFMLWRLDSRWQILNDHHLAHSPSHYLKNNFLVTTSGVCDNDPLLCSINALGEDNILFSTDYPYESVPVAASFIDNAPISDDVKIKICSTNAERWLRL